MKFQRYMGIGIIVGTATVGYVLSRILWSYAELPGPVTNGDAYGLLASLVGLVFTALIGYIFGVGMLIASFGAEKDGEGYFKIRDNWVGRWFLPKPTLMNTAKGISWCDASMHAAISLLGKIFLAILCAVVAAAVGFLFWDEPILAMKGAGVIVLVLVFFIALFCFAQESGKLQDLGVFAIMLYIVCGAGYALYLVPWAASYGWAKNGVSSLVSAGVHPFAWVIIGIVAFGIAFALLMRIEKVHSTVCPRTRSRAPAAPADPPVRMHETSVAG